MTTALITGASSGIGAIYADRLAARGYDLLLVARRGDRLHALADDLQQRHGVKISTLVADLSKAEGIQLVETVLRDDTTINLLVNNAGAANLAPVLSSNADQHEAINTLNTTALMRLTLAVLPRFVENNQGTIINIASVVAFHARAGSAVYSATKAWVLNFTRGLQEEFAGSNVRIQAVLPAATATEIWGHSGITLDALPEGSVMTSEDLVDAALAGLDQGELITVPPVEDLQLWDNWEAARLALFSASRNGKPASRYSRD
ncbi:SDR family NAD(P)-dependent oxidoreductase [Kosakonia pseudosacchari]|uniref:SDR family NAD(P)-dependent oxidoreductase n=1 Tax=Kosakonia pseudosacchari TaxID=1646340 RepID=UPI00187E6F68|nr:SDR family oxidoreductase [Kosakonia pseudosacchari]QOV65607.1 SDR family oxidoreductase [Kosakonia pseudosacchari]